MNIGERTPRVDKHDKIVRAIGVTIFALLLIACGGAAVTGGTSGTPTAPPPVTLAPGEFVLIWQVFGTPTAMPTLEPTALAMHSTAEAIRLTQVKNPPTAAVASGSGGSSANEPGDAARGQRLFGGAATCSTCHDTKAGMTIVGPSLKGIATRAGSREPGKSAEDYIRESILTPNSYVVKGFTPGLMPQNFSKLLTQKQINDLIAYLLTLK